MKPGINTSEFWLVLVSQLCVAAIAVDLFPVASLGAKVTAMASMTLGALGYAASRSFVKR